MRAEFKCHQDKCAQRQGVSGNSDAPQMFIKIALTTALVIGGASAALASDSGENHQDEDRSVVSGSVARGNPRVDKSANSGGAHGYAAAPIHKQRPVHEPNQRF
jgi:hypothetical protein